MIINEANKRFYYRDGKLFNREHWNSRAPKDAEAGTDCHVRGFIYRGVRINGVRYLIHRLIWMMHNGEIMEKMEIDHINGDTLDNRIENLRCVPPHINRRNMRKVCTCTSGITGVTWDKVNKKWYAHAHSLDGKMKNLGRFESKEEAAQVVVAFRKRNGYTDRHGQ